MSYDDHCHALLGVGTPESHSKDKTCYDSRKANDCPSDILGMVETTSAVLVITAQLLSGILMITLAVCIQFINRLVHHISCAIFASNTLSLNSNHFLPHLELALIVLRWRSHDSGLTAHLSAVSLLCWTMGDEE